MFKFRLNYNVSAFADELVREGSGTSLSGTEPNIIVSFSVLINYIKLVLIGLYKTSQTLPLY